MKYQVRITYPNGQVSYLIHRDRMSWCKRSAQKHMTEFSAAFGLTCELEPV